MKCHVFSLCLLRGDLIWALIERLTLSPSDRVQITAKQALNPQTRHLLLPLRQNNVVMSRDNLVSDLTDSIHVESEWRRREHSSHLLIGP